MEVTGNIFNIQHFSVNDGPGIRTVVFFKGCPLDCKWCHNPESKACKREIMFFEDKCINCGKCSKACDMGVQQFRNGIHVMERNKCVACGECESVCPVSAIQISGKEYSVDEVIAELAKDDIFFGTDGGVTFSGGEPFMQFEFLYELLRSCKGKGYSTCIETSGFTTKRKILKATEYTDFFLFDYKETDLLRHLKYTGVDNRQIVENLQKLNDVGADVILRCPIIPGINDREEHFRALGDVTDRYDCILHTELMPYHSLGERKSINLGKNAHSFGEVTEEEKNKWLAMMREFTGKRVVLG